MVKSLFVTKLKRRLAPYLPFLFKGFLVAVVALILVALVRFLPTYFQRLSAALFATSRTSLSLFQSPSAILKTTKGRTNVLLLGRGGAGHEAPDLTDTIIFFSFNHQTGRTLMISLPRDLWVDSLKAKLNTAFYYGNQKVEGGGIILARAAVEEIIGQPIHYATVIDFSAFEAIIDLVGGVEINIPEAFDDLKYPIPGKENVLPISDRYEKLHFDSGIQTMNGARALKYVRSRNAVGAQGTDYARSARQQQVILSLEQRVLSTKLLLEPQKIIALSQLINHSVATDIVDGDFTGFIKLALKFDRSKLQTAALDQGDEDRQGLLVNPPEAKYKGQWVLTGRNGSWAEVQTYVANLLD